MIAKPKKNNRPKKTNSILSLPFNAHLIDMGILKKISIIQFK